MRSFSATRRQALPHPQETDLEHITCGKVSPMEKVLRDVTDLWNLRRNKVVVTRGKRWGVTTDAV